ncbi:serpin family protein [Haloarchaeobius amylolyticus]|uniref:serpin family protein n=1 Tax=Haloarchaeobius amylolyticus TaxID=1198296 RepID=UPI00226EEA81|nr:serpin family protein [Haloarchaeobius amylolyticus]
MNTWNRREVLALAGALSIPALAGCLGSLGNGGSTVTPGLLASDLARDTDPAVDTDTLREQVRANTAFALDLHHNRVAAKPGENLFVSPLSISLAMAMVWAGARGDTEAQIAETLHYVEDQADLHPTFNRLDLAIDTPADAEDESFRLDLVNALWGQSDYPFSEEYLDVIARNYGAGLRTLDFVAEPEPARVTINDWVADQTEDRIQDLLSPGTITDDTRLVGTNAVYFKAQWVNTFPEDATSQGTFTALDDAETQVPLMRQSELSVPYAEVDGAQAVELPYEGDAASMVVILPPEGEFESYEQNLDADALHGLFDALEPNEGRVVLPKFTFGSAVGLNQALKDLGMADAFDHDLADFSGMVEPGTPERLAIDDVVHQTFVAVDENGTEAAAATAVVVGTDSAPMDPFEFVADRPFLFAIRHRETDSVLFLGRVVDAAAAQ